jgi:hypothetical protein
VAGRTRLQMAGVKDNARRSPSRPPAGGCSSVRESAASPSPRSPVRTRSSTPDRPSPIGKRRHAQTVEVQGSSPWGGTQVTRRATGHAALCPGKASRLVTAPVPKTGEQRELPCGFKSRPACAARARLAGHRTFNPDCRGSSPLGGTDNLHGPIVYGLRSRTFTPGNRVRLPVGLPRGGVTGTCRAHIPGDAGASPVRATNLVSSNGRTPDRYSGGRGSSPLARAPGVVAQSGSRAPGRQPGGREFESRRSRCITDPGG